MRLLLKLSGEVLGGQDGVGLDADALAHFALVVGRMRVLGYEVAIVTGGGNMMRGKFATSMDRSRADQIGMMATVMNCMALEDALEHAGFPACAMSAVPSLARPYNIFEARRLLSQGTVVLVAGGTSNPYFTTDSASALRALELQCDLYLKATKVNGIYDKDPKKYPDAVRYSAITFAEVLEKRLGVMDLTAITLCQENGLPIKVCSVADLDRIKEIIEGDQLATMVK